MRFMVIVKASEESESGTLPEEKDFAAMGRFNEELVKAGVMLAGEGLHPSAKGARIAFGTGNTRTVVDGPFAETKELVAGYWLLQTTTRAECIEWIKRAPFEAGAVVRQHSADARSQAEDFAAGSDRRAARAGGGRGRRGAVSRRGARDRRQPSPSRRQFSSRRFAGVPSGPTTSTRMMHLVVVLLLERLPHPEALAARDHVAGEGQHVPSPARRRPDEPPAAEEEDRGRVYLRARVVAPVAAHLPAPRELQRLLVVFREAEIELSQLPAADHRALRVVRGRGRASLRPGLCKSRSRRSNPMPQSRVAASRHPSRPPASWRCPHDVPPNPSTYGAPKRSSRFARRDQGQCLFDVGSAHPSQTRSSVFDDARGDDGNLGTDRCRDARATRSSNTKMLHRARSRAGRLAWRPSPRGRRPSDGP